MCFHYTAGREEKQQRHVKHAIHTDLASAYALNGEIERAAAELTEARGLSSDDRYSSLVRLGAPECTWARDPRSVRSHL
jgi:hypothetical protein